MRPRTGRDLVKSLRLAYTPPQPPAISEELQNAIILTAFSSLSGGTVYVNGRALVNGSVKDFNFNF